MGHSRCLFIFFSVITYGLFHPFPPVSPPLTLPPCPPQARLASGLWLCSPSPCHVCNLNCGGGQEGPGCEKKKKIFPQEVSLDLNQRGMNWSWMSLSLQFTKPALFFTRRVPCSHPPLFLKKDNLSFISPTPPPCAECFSLSTLCCCKTLRRPLSHKHGLLPLSYLMSLTGGCPK